MPTIWAAAYAFSTICASSKHTRHQRSRDSGVATTCLFVPNTYCLHSLIHVSITWCDS